MVAVLIVGFAGALNALGNFTSSDFIAVAVPLAALLGVLAVARGTGEADGRPGNGHGHGSGAAARARHGAPGLTRERAENFVSKPVQQYGIAYSTAIAPAPARAEGGTPPMTTLVSAETTAPPVIAAPAASAARRTASQGAASQGTASQGTPPTTRACEPGRSG